MASDTGNAGRRLGAAALVVGAVFVALVGLHGGGDAVEMKKAIVDGRSWPRIAAVFPADMSEGHFCTAAVVDSPSKDLLITAAHCVTGDPTSLTVVPGYDTGRMPWGVWPVRAVYMDKRWLTRHDPLRDWAFLSVAPIVYKGERKNLEDVTGGVRLGFKSHDRDHITVAGFNAGIKDPLIKCYNQLTVHNQYAQVDCGGITGGMSGAPVMTGQPNHRHVVGVIGGLHNGGCYANVSYAAQFGWPTYLLFLRASQAGGKNSDVDTTSAPNGC